MSKDRRDFKSSKAVKSKHTLSGPLVIGRRAVLEVLRSSPERVKRVFLAENKISKDETGALSELLKLINEHDFQVVEVSKDELSNLSASTSHQSIALELNARNQDFKAFVKRVEAKEHAVILALDEVQDPHNLGAILRVAECFGVTAVIWSKNRSVGITPAVTKASVGASELLEWYEVSNLRDALLKLREVGFWIIATAKTENAQNLTKFDWTNKSVIVMGGEGQGVSNLVLKDSDFQVWIPTTGRIESLNVSQATTIMLWEWSRFLECQL